MISDWRRLCPGSARCAVPGGAEIMSAFRGSPSSEGHDFGPGRSLMIQQRHWARRYGAPRRDPTQMSPRNRHKRLTQDQVVETSLPPAERSSRMGRLDSRSRFDIFPSYAAPADTRCQARRGGEPSH
jgi:hypothetical protein